MPYLAKVALIVICICYPSFCLSFENAFYVLRGDTLGQSKATQKVLITLDKNAKAIDLLITQAYRINKDGNVTGQINPFILKFAHAHAIKLLAMVTNSGFDKKSAHQFLTDPKAQDKALKFIIDIALKNHLQGIQFDFEMIPFTDKAVLTHFYILATNTLHQKGLIISFALAPTITDGPFPSEFQRRLYANWEGAYDFKVLGASADFITLMTYDQHIDRVTPGPNASIRWVEAALKHALKYIPAQKISLGIPDYSGFWYTGTRSNKPNAKINLQYDPLSYEVAMRLMKKNDAPLLWDNIDKVNYTFYERNWLNEYIFLENAKSFQAKLALAKKYHLRGISVFSIGNEDPEIWNVLESGAMTHVRKNISTQKK